MLASCSKDEVNPAENEQVLFETDFSKDDGMLWVGTEEVVSASIEDGNYNFINEHASRSHWSAFSQTFSDAYTSTAIETRVNLSSTDDEEPGAGGLFWNRNMENASDFAFMINNVGQFTIGGYPDGTTYTVYQDWTSHTAVHSNAFNVLRIESRDNEFHFFINGTEVYSMQAVNSASLDRFGFLVSYKSALQADYFKAVALK